VAGRERGRSLTGAAVAALQHRPVAALSTAIGGVSLVFALILDASTLTRLPEPFGDEAMLGSEVWSLFHGHGMRPVESLGIGVYDHTFDYWMPRLGLVPQMAAQLVAGTSFSAYRAGSLVTTFIAFGLLVAVFTRRYGFARASAAVAAIATTWIVFESSHYIRADDVTFLWASIVLALLISGPPGPQRTFVVGAMLGFAPDFSVPTTALVPAVGLLAVWTAPAKGRRLLLYLSGVVVGFAIYAASHFLPDPSTAERQWKVWGSVAYRPPILEALSKHSLHPLFAERTRYSQMATPFFSESRWLLAAAVAGAVAVLVVRLRRGAYPYRTVGPLLLLSQLIGLALLYANHAPLYLIGAMPFAAAALLELLDLIPARGAAATVSVAVLALFTAAGGRAIHRAVAISPPGAATDPQMSKLARSLLPAHGVAMGDFVYWWLFQSDRYRFNGAIWFRRWAYGRTFDQAFEASCPKLVLLDDFWLARYTSFGPGSLGKIFPNLAPTDPTEQFKLMRILLTEYAYPPKIAVAGGRAIEFWRRDVPCRRG
jgi:hypothetical protein